MGLGVRSLLTVGGGGRDVVEYGGGAIALHKGLGVRLAYRGFGFLICS